MNRKLNTKTVIISALLCAMGIIIPLFSPIKIILEPASFTLASHVAIFIAMFISPGTALFVTIGTTVGFFLGGFPITVVLRALSHVVFVLIGSIVMPFYFGTSLSQGYYDKGFLVAVVGLVGVGTIIHSMVDMGLAVYIWNVLPKEVRRNTIIVQKA